MENALWKLLGFLIAAVLLFLAPLVNLAQRQEDMLYTVILSETNAFADSVRDTGYLTPSMVEALQETLSATGQLYSVRLKHVKSLIEPVMVQSFSGGTMALTPTGAYQVSHYELSEEAIFETLFPPGSTLSPLHPLRRYNLASGDLFFVEVQNRGSTLASTLRNMLLTTRKQYPTLFVRSGGMVRNEAY